MRRIIPLAMVLVFVLPRTSSAQNPGLSGFLLRFFAPSNPVILADTGHAARFGSQPGAQATLTQFVSDSFGDRLSLAGIRSCRDDEVSGQRTDLADVQEDDVFSLLFEGRLGRRFPILHS